MPLRCHKSVQHAGGQQDDAVTYKVQHTSYTIWHMHSTYTQTRIIYTCTCNSQTQPTVS